MGEDDKPKTLVGIVAEVRAVLDRTRRRRRITPTGSVRRAAFPWWFGRPPIRAAAAGALRAALRSEDAQLPIPAIRTMEEVVDSSVAERRFQLTLMAVFAASALLVASLGIYGVVSYSVARRRNEIGIRMALGAQRSQLLVLVIRQGMAPVVVGLAAGVGRRSVARPGDSRPAVRRSADRSLTIAGVAVVLLVVGALSLPHPGSPGGWRRCHCGTPIRVTHMLSSSRLVKSPSVYQHRLAACWIGPLNRLSENWPTRAECRLYEVRPRRPRTQANAVF